MAREALPPRKYYTKERIHARQEGDHPPTLFHFTTRTKALRILEDGFLRGHPELSTTENPAFVVPGPVVFVIDAQCALREGFDILPHLWSRGAEEEAEWILVPAGAESRHDLPGATALPLKCVVYVGLIGRFGAEREAIMAAAQELEISTGQFDWEEWWGNGPSMSGPQKLPFFSTCVGWPLPVPELQEMIDTSKTISRATFLKHVDPEQMKQLEKELGYTRDPRRGLTMAGDYHVSYDKSTLRGCPAVFFTWSAIEHVFVDSACLESARPPA